jgi:hypothetical protein
MLESLPEAGLFRSSASGKSCHPDSNQAPAWHSFLLQHVLLSNWFERRNLKAASGQNLYSLLTLFVFKKKISVFLYQASVILSKIRQKNHQTFILYF